MPDTTLDNNEPMIALDENKSSIPDAIGGLDGKFVETDEKLPSGSIARVEKFAGIHVLEALSRGNKKEGDTEDNMLWELIAGTTTINKERLSADAIDDMDGRDVDFLMGKFSAAFKDKTDVDADLPDAPKTGCYYKRLPDGRLALIERYKGRHIKEATRQMKKDASDYLPVLMSRMITIDGSDLFPEDLYTMDGLAFLSLLGEVADAMFPAA